MIRRILLALSTLVAVLLVPLGPAAPAADSSVAQEAAPIQLVAAQYVCHPRTIPQADCDAAVYVYEFALTHGWAAPQGYKGNKKFNNDPPVLPAGGDYLEYDIYPKPPPNTGGRDSKRIVIDKGTQIAFYTADHYVTFAQLSYSE